MFASLSLSDWEPQLQATASRTASKIVPRPSSNPRRSTLIQATITRTHFSTCQTPPPTLSRTRTLAPSSTPPKITNRTSLDSARSTDATRTSFESSRTESNTSIRPTSRGPTSQSRTGSTYGKPRRNWKSEKRKRRIYSPTRMLKQTMSTRSSGARNSWVRCRSPSTRPTTARCPTSTLSS